jgi:hypothetical protein
MYFVAAAHVQIKLAAQHISADDNRDGQTLHAHRKLKQRIDPWSLHRDIREIRFRLATLETRYF